MTNPLTIGMLERYESHCKTAQALGQPIILVGTNDVLRMIGEIYELREKLRDTPLNEQTGVL